MISSARNRAGTIFVRADDQGIPITVKIDRCELRTGGAAVAAQILELCGQAGVQARADQREQLSAAGVSEDTLDRLGLPTRPRALELLAQFGANDAPPTSWMTGA